MTFDDDAPGVLDVLRGAAVELGLESAVGGLVAGADPRVVTVSSARGSFRVETFGGGEAGGFLVTVTGFGLTLVSGPTRELGALVRALAAWRAGATIGRIRDEWHRFPVVFPLADLHEAVPGAVVETTWSLMLEQHPNNAPGDLPLVRACAAEPRLRELFPRFSHGTLHFLRNTRFPWEDLIPFVVVAANGYKVYSAGYRSLLAEDLTAEQAAAFVVGRLPPGYGPAFEGGWPAA